MPPVRSVSIAPDSLTIESIRGTRTFTRADIPANVLAQPVDQIEAFVNAWLASHIDEMQVFVHIFSVNPTLHWIFKFVAPGTPVLANWWSPS